MSYDGFAKCGKDRCPICDAPRQLCPDCYEQDTDCTCYTEDQP